MVIFLFSVIAFSILVTLIFLYLSQNVPYQDGSTDLLRAALFCMWLIAMVMWPRQFYVLRVAGMVDLTIERVVFICLAISFLYGFFAKPSARVASRKIELLFLLFSLLCFVSMGIHGFRETPPFDISPWFVYITAHLFPFAAFIFARRYLRSERAISAVFHALFYMGVYLSIMAFLEFFNMRQYVYPQFINDPKVWLHLERARGPYLNAAFNGFTLVIGFICGIYVLASKHGFNRVLHGALISLFFPAIFFTLTRSVYLCFLFALTGVLIAYRTTFPKRLLALPISFILIFGVLNASHLGSSDRRAGGVYQIQEVQIRESLFKRSVIMILDNPVFGVGLGQFIPASVAKYKGLVPIPESSGEQTQHFQLIGMTVELGLVGVIFYVAILVTFFRRFRTLFTRLPDMGFISPNLVLLLGLGMGAFVLNNFFIDASFHLFPNVIYFTFGGMMESLYNQLCSMPVQSEQPAAVMVSTTLSAQGA